MLLFLSIITFPIVRIISTSLNEKINLYAMQRKQKKLSEYTYNRLSSGEKEVIQAFVTAGGTALTYSHVNSLELSAPAIETLIQREIIWSSMTADGMRETFALDTEIFDIAQKKRSENRKGCELNF
ncbi:MAG: superinfection exclusion B family protein [Sulfurospirillum sp.]|nr:superinfection exclusion B family protein [Sulfurospirillum sp.]